MRALSLVLMLFMVVLVCPALRGHDEPSGSPSVVLVTVHDLNLTDDQKAKIASIRKEYKPKIEEAANDLAAQIKEEVEQVRGVLTDEQKEKLQAFREERKEQRFDGLAERIANLKDLHLTEEEVNKIEDIRSEYRPKIEKAMEGLKGILTDDQRTSREDALRTGKSHAEILASLNLSGEQKEKLSAACKEAGTAVREELEKIKEVLTPEQQARMSEFKDERADRVRDRWAHRVANFKELNLTDEQKTKIENIRKEFRPKIQEAANKLRATIREKVSMITDVLRS